MHELYLIANFLQVNVIINMKHFIIQHYTTLYNRRFQDIVIFMYKVKYGLIPGNVSDLFINKDTRYLLRNSDFELPRFNTVCYGKHSVVSVRYLGPFLWSKLSTEMRDLPSLNSFKNNIRKQNLSGLIDNNNKCCNICIS